MSSGANPITRFSAGLSARGEAESAADDLCDRVRHANGFADARCDLGFLFISEPFASKAETIDRIVHDRLGVRTLVTVSGTGVIGGRREVEKAPAVSLLVGELPGVDVRPFILQDLPRPPAEADATWAREHFGPILGASDDLRATFLFADPFSVPLVRLLPLIAAGRGEQSGPLLGAMASAGTAPGQNVLAVNGGMMNAGGVGVSLSGPIRVDPIVSQGCRPFGPTMIVTKARGNVLLELGGRPALEAVRDGCMALPEGRRKQLEGGLYIGRVINEYKDRFGRDDFLIRAVRGVDEKSRAILTDDLFRIGQTVRLHLRDAQTADEDLAMLLDKEKLKPKPAAALLFAGRERGEALFGRPNHDAEAINRAFQNPLGGEAAAKSGEEIDAAAPPSLPIAGAFAAGEIGPGDESTYMHGQTAIAALFRQQETAEET